MRASVSFNRRQSFCSDVPRENQRLKVVEHHEPSNQIKRSRPIYDIQPPTGHSDGDEHTPDGDPTQSYKPANLFDELDFNR